MPETPNPEAREAWFKAERAKNQETGILSSLIREQAELPQVEIVRASESYAGEQVRRIVSRYTYVFQDSLPQVVRIRGRVMLNTDANLLYHERSTGDMLALGDRDWYEHRGRIVHVIEQALLEQGAITHKRSGK